MRLIIKRQIDFKRCVTLRHRISKRNLRKSLLIKSGIIIYFFVRC